MTAIEVEKELLNQIKQYLNGEITKEYFYDISEPFYTENAHLIEKTEFKRVYMGYIPDACMYYIDEPGLTKEKRESEFRECLEKAYPLLKELING